MHEGISGRASWRCENKRHNRPRRRTARARGLRAVGTAMLVTLEIALGTGCTSRHPAAAGGGDLLDAVACTGVTISPTKAVVATAFDVEYTIVLAPTHHDSCLLNDFGDLNGERGSPVALRAAADEVMISERLGHPVRFDRARVSRDGSVKGVTGTPGLDRVSRQTSAEKRVVPAGQYRLIVRYRPPTCDGRTFAAMCVAVSSPFTIDHDTVYSTEY